MPEYIGQKCPFFVCNIKKKICDTSYISLCYILIRKETCSLHWLKFELNNVLMWHDMDRHIWHRDTCNMTWRYIWHNMETHVTWHGETCNIAWKDMWHDMETHIIWQRHMWHDTEKYDIDTCDMTWRHMWHDMETHVTWHYHSFEV
jgi:hypothetical protein